MRERPILFNGEMVRAILDGRKTQTRRVIKPQPFWVASSGRWCWEIPKRAQNPGCSTTAVTASRQWHEYLPDGCCPYGVPGDKLWVRETWKSTGLLANSTPRYTRACGRFAYRADLAQRDRDLHIPWRASIHMPRWASRITLEVTDVRVERVQDITEDGAIREGCCDANHKDFHVGAFHDLWDSINAKRGFGWDSNPWVWVVEFKRVDP